MLRIKSLLFFIALLFTTLAPCLAAADMTAQIDYTAFSQIPINHQGRVKPLGRVAQISLRHMAQIDLTIPQASAWLANLLFDPQSADQPALFHIRNPHLLHVLQLEQPDPTHTGETFYNFQTLNRAFTQQADLILGLRQMQPDQLQADQQDLLALYAQVTWYEQLKNAMTLLLPLAQPSGKRLIDLDTGDHHKAQTVIDYLKQAGQMNQSFRVIPVQHHGNNLTWMAPWEYWLQRDTLPDNAHNQTAFSLLHDWSQLAQAFINQDNHAWHDASDKILATTLSLTKEVQPLLRYQIKAELLYHVISPYLLSLYFYLAALLVSLAGLRLTQSPLYRTIIYRTTVIVFSCGIAAHLLGLAMRIFILQRPPVSNLYESILFVGALLAMAGLWYIHRKREAVLLPALAITSIALQLLGFALNDEGDTLQVLQAVLDTKFWLAVHVMTITAGYALCLVTALLAHAALFLASRQPDLVMHSHRFYKRAFYFSLLSLLFVSIGTLLGGVWADQSWGRFWGWDPKENGALLIVLWLIWLLHGRVSRHFSDRALIIGLALLNIIVGISWIGVNLLGVGLHAYGFISGSAISLLILVFAEIFFFGLCGFLYYQRRHRHA